MSDPLVYIPKTGPNAPRYKTAPQKKRKKSKGLQTFLDLIVVLLVAGATYAMFKLTNVKPENQEINNPTVAQTSEPSEEPEAEPEAEFNLQPVLSSWLSEVGASVPQAGIVVFDLDNSAILAQVNAEAPFSVSPSSEWFAQGGVTTPLAVLDALASYLDQPEYFTGAASEGLSKSLSTNVIPSERLNLAHNGAYYTIYNTVVVLRFKDYNRRFAVVALSKDTSTAEDFARRGAMLEEAILAYLEIE